MTKDPYESAEWRDFEKRVKNELVPKVRASAMSMVLNPGEDPDVKVAVELGMSILLDKPLIIVATPGDYISPALERAADEVIRVDLKDPTSSEQVGEAINEILKKRGLR